MAATNSAHHPLPLGSVPRDGRMHFFEKLGDIETFGDFACMTRYSHHINPGLQVAGSLIPLLLVDRDASTIKSKCEQAPFGRGDDTVVDRSVRRTWQLDAGHFRCSNPAWPAFLDSVLRETVQKLGMYVLMTTIGFELSWSLIATHLNALPGRKASEPCLGNRYCTKSARSSSLTKTLRRHRA